MTHPSRPALSDPRVRRLLALRGVDTAAFDREPPAVVAAVLARREALAEPPPQPAGRPCVACGREFEDYRRWCPGCGKHHICRPF
jgi:hypothetical protein